jgi:RNA polymerase sigma factor (sigma-70 family)
MTPRALFHPARLARRPVLSTQSDERLVDLVRAGSESAFETIVERYRRALMRYVSRLLPPERAEDVVQQAFVNAYEAMHRGGAELNLRPWLYRIAHNTALNALRDRGLRHDELDERIDGVERPDQALERSQGLRDVLVAVQALPERQRDAILLRELEGRSYEEIALALGVTGGAVRQLLNRARNSLRSAAAALTPMPLLTRLASGDSTEPAAARVAEMVGVGAAGSGAVMAKLCATALVTGVVVAEWPWSPRAAATTGAGQSSRRPRPRRTRSATALDPRHGVAAATPCSSVRNATGADRRMTATPRRRGATTTRGTVSAARTATAAVPGAARSRSPTTTAAVREAARSAWPRSQTTTAGPAAEAPARSTAASRRRPPGRTTPVPAAVAARPTRTTRSKRSSPPRPTTQARARRSPSAQAWVAPAPVRRRRGPLPRAAG